MTIMATSARLTASSGPKRPVGFPSASAYPETMRSSCARKIADRNSVELSISAKGVASMATSSTPNAWRRVTTTSARVAGRKRSTDPSAYTAHWRRSAQEMNNSDHRVRAAALRGNPEHDTASMPAARSAIFASCSMVTESEGPYLPSGNPVGPDTPRLFPDRPQSAHRERTSSWTEHLRDPRERHPLGSARGPAPYSPQVCLCASLRRETTHLVILDPAHRVRSSLTAPAASEDHARYLRHR